MIYPIALDEVGYGPVGKPVWTGMDGFGMRSGVEWFVTDPPFPCTGGYSLYCVEQ